MKFMNINFKKISFITFFIIFFYEIFIKLRGIFYKLKIIYWKPLLHCPSTYIIYISILNTKILYFYHNLPCISYQLLDINKWSNIFLLLYLSLLNISISIKISNFIFVFLKLLVMLIQQLKEIFQYQVHIF